MLAERAPSLVRELLPNGRKHGAEWRCGSLAGERGQSLAVHLGGARSGVWADFSSAERGDALDLVAAVLYGGDRRKALVWARQWLGLGNGDVGPVVRRSAPMGRTSEVDTDAQARRAAARKVWFAGEPLRMGSPAAAYLAGRGIDLLELGRVPGSLRFHTGLWNGESQRHWPAMLAGICAPDGAMVAMHRTWLAPTPSGGWSKAPLRDAKMTLGSYAGGCIRLWRGASGKPLAFAPEGETAVLAEGIETALSIAISCPEHRVLCAVSLANMARVVLPAAIRTVIVAADNDEGNASARRALDVACQWFLSQGRDVRLAMPDRKDADWNDILQEMDA
ncbi:hypothetical protein AA103193_2559 [Tanticharoenia sakaeratensis NBRC 103193]|nr:toprim domain-containing protein [Tanticharoenia sakaeratensis]GBQ23872.1 hypothetical protein AA103193_2559 [Tanticharoenia sakaeratensis NBRC 103193]